MNVLLVLFSIAFGLLGIEFLTRVLDQVSPKPARSWRESRLALPLPYKKSPFSVEKLIAEAEQITWKTDRDYGYRPDNFSGELINIENGFRRTINNPSFAERRMWIFGGSTIICLEVPDAYTIPSQLSALVNAQSENQFEVINSGASTITSRHQLFKLKNSTTLKKNDIVVFMDGWNDIAQSLYYNNPMGNMIEKNRQQIETASFSEKLILELYVKYGESSAFIRRFLNPFRPEEKEITITENNLQVFEKDYLETMIHTHEYVKSKGAKYFHFLQPSVSTLKQPTTYEKILIDQLAQGYLIPKPLIKISHQAYPRLQNASQDARKMGINAFDITDAFDHKTTDVYLDSVHVNEVGNRILAEGIWARVEAELDRAK